MTLQSFQNTPIKRIEEIGTWKCPSSGRNLPTFMRVLAGKLSPGYTASQPWRHPSSYSQILQIGICLVGSISSNSVQGIDICLLFSVLAHSDWIFFFKKNIQACIYKASRNIYSKESHDANIAVSPRNISRRRPSYLGLARLTWLVITMVTAGAH